MRAAASSAPAPNTMRSFSGLLVSDVAGVSGAWVDAADPDGSADAEGEAAEAEVLALGRGVADAGTEE